MSTSTSPQSDSKPSLGEELYSGSASFGRFWALLGAIFGTIIGIIAIVIGIIILVHKDTTVHIFGKVLQINAGSPQAGICPMAQQNLYSCEVQVSYTYNGQNYVAYGGYSGSQPVNIGQEIPIRIDPKNPSVVDLSQPVPKWVGGMLIGIALLMILGGWFWYWASRKWKIVAAAEGASGLLSVASGGRI